MPFNRGMRCLWAVVGALLAPALACACSGGTTVSVPSGVTEQYTDEFLIDVARRVIVLTVDDGPGADSAAIRQTTKTLLRTTFEERFAVGSRAGLESDWARADMRVVIVHPSVGGSARAVGPSDDPALAVVSDHASTAAIDVMADEAGRTIDAAVAPAGAPYPLLDATVQTIGLVTGARAPEDAHEAALVASLGTPEIVGFVVATARDDDGTTAVRGDVARTTPVWFDDEAIFAPGAGADAPCSGDLVLPERLAAWSRALQAARVYTEAYDTTCQDDVSRLAQSGFLGAIVDDGFHSCFPAPIAHDADGAGVCVVAVTMFDGASCSSHPGMLDPRDPDGVRRPRTAADATGPTRVCEIQALAGERAAACRESNACTGCGAGWCDFTADRRCGAVGALRIVHGAVPPGRATLDVTCDLAPR